MNRERNNIQPQFKRVSPGGKHQVSCLRYKALEKCRVEEQA